MKTIEPFAFFSAVTGDWYFEGSVGLLKSFYQSICYQEHDLEPMN